jgi:hypothetical protein
LTAIWDHLGGKVSSITPPPFDDGEWNQKTGDKLKQVIEAIYIIIKDCPEYKDWKTGYVFTRMKPTTPLLLDNMKEVIAKEHIQASDLLSIKNIVESLHDFDHNTYAQGNKDKTWGHHTEQIIRKALHKKDLKKYAEIIFEANVDAGWWEK